MNKPKVYVVAKGSHDFSQAVEHGEITFLFSDKANVFAADQLVKDIEDKLAGSKPDDFLILAGSMLPAAIAFYVLMQKHGIVNNLIFSFKNNNYEIRSIRSAQFVQEV